jgi:hypothetical protein
MGLSGVVAFLFVIEPSAHLTTRMSRAGAKLPELLGKA